MAMARSQGLTSSLPKPFWRYGGKRNGYEHHHYPSERARRLFYYARSVGEAHPRPGFHHSHRDQKGFLLHVVLRGEFWHQIKDRRHVTRANECCLLDMTEPIEYGNDGPPSVHVYWAHLDGTLMPHVYRELNADIDPVFRNLNPARITRVFRKLIRLTAEQPADYEPQASTLISSLLTDLFASRAGSLPPPDAGIDPGRLSGPIRQALALIARYYMQPKNVKSIAAEVGLSRYHFCRLFHRETGHTPSQYLSYYRLDAARNLLTATDKPIQQVARSVGIPNVENFSKLFRQHHGLSPRAYRDKQARG